MLIVTWFFIPAHLFAMRRAASPLSPLSCLSESWNGFEQAKLMKSLASMSHESLRETVVPKLVKLKEIIFNKNRLRWDHILAYWFIRIFFCRFSINCEGRAVDNTLSLLDLFGDELNNTKVKNVGFHPSLIRNCYIDFFIPDSHCNQLLGQGKFPIRVTL